jgi:hypothetical protein
MLSLALTRAPLPASLGAASVGLLAGATEFFKHDRTLRAPSAPGSYETRLTGAATATLVAR